MGYSYGAVPNKKGAVPLTGYSSIIGVEIHHSCERGLRLLVPSSLRTEMYQIIRGYIHMGFQRQWTVLLCVSDCPLLTAYPFPRHALAQHATSVRYEWSPHAAATKLLQLTPIARLGQLCLNRNVVKLQTYVDPRKHRATSTPRAVSCTRPERWYVDVFSMVRQFVMNGALMLQKISTLFTSSCRSWSCLHTSSQW